MSDIAQGQSISMWPEVVKFTVAVATVMPSILLGVVALTFGPKSTPVDFEGNSPSRFSERY